MGLVKILEKIGVSLDLDCVYSINYSGGKVLIAYQGIIEIDNDKVRKS